MVKTRINRKKRANRTRKYRMKGKGLKSCEVYKNKKNPLWSHTYGNFVTVVEDDLKIAKPNQKFCFGDAFTSCTVVAVVMENNYKVAAHINPINHILSNTNEAPRQYRNPHTVLPLFQGILQTNPNFRDSNIKIIYVITSLDGIYIDKPVNNVFTTNIFNDQYAAIRKNENRVVRLSNSNKDAFFSSIFPGKITQTTVIDVQHGKVVQHGNDGPAHFFIREDGSLDLKE